MNNTERILTQESQDCQEESERDLDPDNFDPDDEDPDQFNPPLLIGYDPPVEDYNCAGLAQNGVPRYAGLPRDY